MMSSAYPRSPPVKLPNSTKVKYFQLRTVPFLRRFMSQVLFITSELLYTFFDFPSYVAAILNFNNAKVNGRPVGVSA